MELRYREWSETDRSSLVHEILHSVSMILALTDKYVAIVTNPPYMGNGNMNMLLSSYAQSHYREGKADLFAVFMLLSMNLLGIGGKLGMINMQSWMFLGSFEDLRSLFLHEYTFDSMLHLGARTFDELSGEVVQNVSFVVSNCKVSSKCAFYRLVTGSNCSQKESLFINSISSPIRTEQESFGLIPGSPIAYWASDNILRSFQHPCFIQYGKGVKGLDSGNDSVYVRYHWEIERDNTSWVPYFKGGSFRRWYGNKDYVIKWPAVSNYKSACVRNKTLYFKEGLEWSRVSGSQFAVRIGEGAIFGGASQMAFLLPGNSLYYFAALLNTKLVDEYIKILNPTLITQAGDVNRIPVVGEKRFESDCIVKSCIDIAKEDWDAHETSVEFKENELVRVCKQDYGDGLFVRVNRLEEIVAVYEEYWTGKFNQLHTNEEELNRQFIEMYGLQDELTPAVPLEEITILQQGEISVESGQLIWHNDVLAKQLLSYAIGCMMGRYRLDRPGLHIAYPNPSASDIETYDFHGEPFEIDDDGIIPLLSRECPFDDNAYNRVVKFVRQVFGETCLNENLNFIEASLGRTIADYFVKDFWKDHKKMYSNRPIYWLFSSKRGSFQCLTYMHRMSPYTVETVRSKYLLPYIDFLKAKIAADMERASSLSTVERRNLDKMQVALDECLEYEERLHDVADHQIHFDLDDGVLVNYAKFGDVLAKIK